MVGVLDPWRGCGFRMDKEDSAAAACAPQLRNQQFGEVRYLMTAAADPQPAVRPYLPP